MAITIAMPQVGDAPTETTIERWLARVGDRVNADDVLFEVQTEKIASEVPSTASGVLREILVEEGRSVMSGAPVCVIDDTLERASPDSGQPAGGAQEDVLAGRALVSPVVRRLLREHGLRLDDISGTGPRGRVTRADVLTVAALPVAASRPEALSRLRAATARRLTQSWQTAPHVFSVIEVDFEAVAARKAALAERTTWLSFIAAAAISALVAVRDLNATFNAEAGTRTFHDAVHLAISVDVGTGLLAPVIRNAETLTVIGLARAIAELARRARAGELRPEELTGSTFTITNPGVYGSLLTGPIINPPNVAILSTDAVDYRVVAIGRAIEVRRRANLCLSWDHRAMDGSTAMRFLAHVKRTLETT